MRQDLEPELGAKLSGTLTAIDPRTNKIAWQNQMPYRIGQGSGTLSTAGGLLLHGDGQQYLCIPHPWMIGQIVVDPKP